MPTWSSTKRISAIWPWKTFLTVLPQDGGESQLASKLRHCHPVYSNAHQYSSEVARSLQCLLSCLPGTGVRTDLHCKNVIFWNEWNLISKKWRRLGLSPRNHYYRGAGGIDILSRRKGTIFAVPVHRQALKHWAVNCHLDPCSPSGRTVALWGEAKRIHN